MGVFQQRTLSFHSGQSLHLENVNAGWTVHGGYDFLRALGTPVLRNAGSSSGPEHRVCIINEIGKMELCSQPFIQAVRQTLATPGTVILGMIPIPKGKPQALVEEIRNRNDVQVFSKSAKLIAKQKRLKKPRTDVSGKLHLSTTKH
ncbi:cancer-related nucleoside-triphosphatase homolog isoform X2 [Mustela putorius furo]|uniref:Cancer-related nucleoside-triphosphatase homolog isoform X2 n=1 Tax=Mustela putorius furo TaxID=9669 RepID=A0A8U0SIF1_MUSPF|nr:cancer-related nucleoside-triphosphatase homolog isoform X2 [Mustela putorius furo]